MLEVGFDLHHIDGDHSNNDHKNLILIETNDHFRIHGFPKSIRRYKADADKPMQVSSVKLQLNIAKTSSSERSLLERVYLVRSQTGMPWGELGKHVGLVGWSQAKLINATKKYATEECLVWPIDLSHIQHEKQRRVETIWDEVGRGAYEEKVKNDLTWIQLEKLYSSEMRRLKDDGARATVRHCIERYCLMNQISVPKFNRPYHKIKEVQV